MQPKTKTTTTIVLIIAVLSLLTLCAHAQELYLDQRMAAVKYDMSRLDIITQTVSAKDYIEYKHNSDSIAFAYRFVSGKCSEAMITFPVSRISRFMDSHPYWITTTTGWQYYSDTFGTYMLITCNQDHITATFTYKLQSNESNQVR